jgi:oligopeptide transport system substrate-binding protein
MSAVSFPRWRVRAVALAVLASAVATACNPTTPLTEGPRLAKDQALRVLLDDQPATLDPGQTQYPYETAVLRAISEPLLNPKADLSGVTPAAAETYDVASNGTAYTFHLRKTAQYWDGTPVKAQDFVYAWQRLIDPRLAAPSGPFFAASILNGDHVSALDPQRDVSSIPAALGTLGVKATDDFTLQVTLSHPNPAFVWIAAMPAGAPIRQDVLTKYADKWATSPDSLVTNGSFRVTEMVPNVHVTVVPNPHYWGAKPKLTSITFDVVNDGAVALAKYKSRELDEIDVQPAQAAVVAADAQLKLDLVKTTALSVFWIVFRLDQAPLNNLKVRQAIAAGIDRDAFVAQIFQGQGLPATTFIPKGMHGYAPDLGTTQTFDLARARATFAASGVSAKDMSAVKFTYDQSSDFSKATAKFIHDQLKTNLGVDITLEAIDSNSYSSRLDTGDFQVAGPLGWMADYPDPSDWFGMFTTNSNNFAFYQNKEYDSLVRTAGLDVQPDRRAQEYKQAQSMLVNDVPAAFLAQAVSWYLVRPYVRGVTTSSVDEWPGALFPAQIYIAAH